MTSIIEDDPLKKAVEDLERAEGRLAEARAKEATAEREVANAVEEIKEAERERDVVTVHVIHVNEVEKASFKEKLTATLQQVWRTNRMLSSRLRASLRTCSRRRASIRSPS